MSRSARVLGSNGNTDALELAMRYCAYALEADALAKETGTQEVGAKKTALAASRTAFTQAVDDVFKGRRAAQEAAEKAALEKAKSDKAGAKP